MTVLLNDLRGDVLWRSADRVGELTIFELHAVFREPKVREFEVTGLADQNVFGLEISIDDALIMKCTQEGDDLGCEKSDLIFSKAAALLQVEEKLATCDVLKDEVKLIFSLERVSQLDDEG